MDILMPIYSLTEYSNNSLKTFGLLWQYCRDDPAVNDDGAIVKFIANTATSLVKKAGQTSHDGWNNVEIMVLLKYLSSFWKFLKKP